MRLEQDFDKYSEDAGFVVLPNGSYYVEIYSAKDQISRADNDMVCVTYSVLNDEYKNAKVFEYLTFTEKSMGRIKHFLHMINEPYEGNCQIDSGNWIGKCLKITVSVETSQDYPDKNRVTGHLPFEPAQESSYRDEKKTKSKEKYQANKQTKDEKRKKQENEFADEMAKKNKVDNIPFGEDEKDPFDTK